MNKRADELVKKEEASYKIILTWVTTRVSEDNKLLKRGHSVTEQEHKY